MAKGMTCKFCNTYVSCPSCEGYICPGCGSELPTDGPKIPMCAYTPFDNDNDSEEEVWDD